MLEKITEINGVVNNFVWGVPALTLLIGTGVVITLLLGFFQFTHFGHALKETIGSLLRKKDKNGILKSSDNKAISQFQAMCTAMSATVGTGNIAGIAYAITMGGPGAVFWMWIAALVGMMTNFAENVLGIFYRRRNAAGEWVGGPMYYLRDGLGSKRGLKTIGKILAVLFSVFTVFASFGIGNMGQFVSITESMTSVLPSVDTNIISWVVGAVVIIAILLVVVGGLKRLAKVNEMLVPFMSIFYIIGAIIILVMRGNMILPALASVFSKAFSLEAAAGGVGGAIIAQAIQWGFKRGVFSNEAGLGSSVMVHSTSDVKEPVTQGLWGIFVVFFDTLVICTLTALVILTTGVVDLNTGASISGVTKLGLATEAFASCFGTFGGIFIAVAITLFAFSTMLGWTFYGTKAWEYLFGTKSIGIYKLLYILVIFAGIVLDASIIIDLSDTFNGLMAIPNLIGVLVLSGTVYKITKNYKERKFKGKDVAPILSAFDKE